MAESILRLRNLTKTFIIGTKKNAEKAQKAIENLQNKYEKDIRGQHTAAAKEKLKILTKAQKLFAAEEYEESYHTITGKKLHKRPHDRGVVVHALRGIDMSIQAGDLVAIMGPSGSGKSTLLNMLGLLDSPTAGQIYIRDKNIADISKHELPEIRSSELGFVFQSFNLITTLTALENVMLPLRYANVSMKERRRMAREALTRVGLENRFDHTPNELSGGQQQRVAIARSIVNHPAIVFGDELTGELDSKMTKEIMRLIVELNDKGQTFIIVTHNPEVAKLCKRVIIMRDGKIESEQRNKGVKA